MKLKGNKKNAQGVYKSRISKALSERAHDGFERHPAILAVYAMKLMEARFYLLLSMTFENMPEHFTFPLLESEVGHTGSSMKEVAETICESYARSAPALAEKELMRLKEKENMRGCDTLDDLKAMADRLESAG